MEQIISVEKAVKLLLNEVDVIQMKEEVQLMEALGRICSEDLKAPFDQPPFPRSPLDGYAVNAGDVKDASKDSPAILRVREEISAGDSPAAPLESGQAVRIMTGAPIPKGAHCTIRQEDTDYGEDTVQIYKKADAWENYCFQGEDFYKGDCLIKAGTKMDAVHIGVASSMGFEKIQVYQKPRIALITTGDELVLPGEELKAGKIYNSNLYVIGARLKELGFSPVCMKAVSDKEEVMAAEIEKIASDVDLIITTGGVSVGKKDIMHGVNRRLNTRKLFWKVGLKPGAPTLSSVYHNTLIISLSGNPFGALANMELLVRPVLAKLANDAGILPEKKHGIMAGEFRKASPGRRFIRAKYKDGRVYLPKALHASGVLSSMAGCNCMIDIPAGNEGLERGDQVCVVML